MSQRTDEIAEAAKAAARRIEDIVVETPLLYSQAFSESLGAEIHFKLENRQHTGSFKLRGAANCLLGLSAEQRAKGIVVASSGNHGAAVAYAMRSLDVPGIIFVPEQTSMAKVEVIRSHGGEVRFFGADGLETEIHAREHAAREGSHYVSPYNDAAVIAGQGSCGIEIVKQLPDVDAAFIAVGGGGLLSGVGSVLRNHNSAMRLYACQPQASAVMARSVEAGKVLDLPSEPTLSDGTAGGVEADSITFESCRELADEFILVGEDEIAEAMRQFMDVHGDTIEGAAGVAIAALRRCRDVIKGMKVVVIVCGGNVSQETVESICGV